MLALTAATPIGIRPIGIKTQPTLGNYPATTVTLSANTTVTPDAAPTNATSLNVSTSTNFKGILEANPATGVVRVTDAHPAGTYTVIVNAFNNSGGTASTTFNLTVMTVPTCDPLTFTGATHFVTGDHPSSIAVGDFNSDGVQDLVTVNSNSANLSILLGDGFGGFGTPTNFTVGSVGNGPYSIAVGDFNGDGKEDLATIRGGSVWILLGDGAGNFGAATNVGAGLGAWTVAVGDFNGDGRQDLVTANISLDTLSILLGDGTGSFGAATNFGDVGHDPFTVVVGDFNGDGKQDLVTANEFSDTDVRILLGDGMGGFSAAHRLSLSRPGVIAVGDFNGDGTQDLAVARTSPDTVSILLGDGTGNFGVPTNFGTAGGFVAVGDFNGDGKQDLAVSKGNNASILLGDGAGNFSPATDFGVGGSPSSIAVGDFNGDGIQDLATASGFQNNVSILLGCNVATLQTPGWATTGSLGTERFSHTATLLPSGKVLVVAGGSTPISMPVTTVPTFLSSAELYDLATGIWSSAGNIDTKRSGHTATLLPSGKVLVAGGYNGNYLSSAQLYDPATGSWTTTGSLGTARAGHTATLLPSGKVLVAGGALGSFDSSTSAELYDPATGSWTNTGSLGTARGYHTATLLSSGKVLVAGGIGNNITYLNSAELYDPATGSWTSTGSLSTPRAMHTGTLLPDGKVLVAGGHGDFFSNSDLSSTELYDPATGNWSSTGSLSTRRSTHTATLLPSGKVLVTGGYNDTDSELSSAELYDPATGTWSSTGAGSLGTARGSQTATLLPSGKVLVVAGVGNGGYLGSGILTSAELYDPTIGSWSGTGSLGTTRHAHTSALLPSGKVLVAGGENDSGSSSSAELYNPATGSWNSTGSLRTARHDHTSTLLPSGKVLVAGGSGISGTLSSAELYDLATGSWSNTGSLGIARTLHTATLLPSGKVLVAGGGNNSAELYDQTTGSWASTGSLSTQHTNHTATLLPSGKVLVAGGGNNSAELYDPATGNWANTGSLGTQRTNHTATLLPSGKVLVAGGGNNSAELYDPATGTWSSTGNLATARIGHTATLLSSGKVLVTGGDNIDGMGNLSSAELYDPATGRWYITAGPGNAHYLHTATLLPAGKVLIAGGSGNSGFSAELYDSGLAFNPGWQPLLATVSPSILPDGSELRVSGSRFKGISEASGNGAQNSSSNYPLVQLLSLTNEQMLFLPVDAMAGWSDTSFTSTPVTLMTTISSGFPIGYALVTVFTNGIPSQSQFVVGPPFTECTVCHKHTTLTLPCNSLEYQRHLGHGDPLGPCPTPTGINAHPSR